MTFSPEETVEQKQARTGSQGRGSSWGLPQAVGRPLTLRSAELPSSWDTQRLSSDSARALGMSLKTLALSPGAGYLGLSVFPCLPL